MKTFKLPDHAAPQGDYALDIVLEMLREHWRNGRQIVPLIGAGISVESGFPVILGLREHLLTLHAMQKTNLKWQEEKWPEVPSYSLERDGWISPARLSERLPFSLQTHQLQKFLTSTFHGRSFWKLNNRDGYNSLSSLESTTQNVINDRNGRNLLELAEILGLGWLELMEEIAEHRPELVDMIFDALGAFALPGPTHNFLTHCVAWFNIRLLLTTNFDSLAEESLKAEGMDPYVYDVHLRSEPPQKVLVDQHLSVIKLHGSHYGIRADRSVNQPIDRGHLATLLQYLDEDVILLCLGYGGTEARITGFISELMKHKPQARLIRIDPLSPWSGHFFSKLAKDFNVKNRDPRVINLYYPPSTGLFLLHLYQYVANRMPNTRGRYPSSPYTAAPHKNLPMLGCDAVWESHFRKWKEPSHDIRSKREKSDEAKKTKKSRNCYFGKTDVLYFDDHNDLIRNTSPDCVIANFKNGKRCQIVRTEITNDIRYSGGTSQILAQVNDEFFRTHQIAWCDLDDVTSVGAVMRWLYDFVNSRQPDLPQTPLPIALPIFQPSAVMEVDGSRFEPLTAEEVRDLQRAVRHLWSRLSREKFVIIMDSLSCALEMVALGTERNTPRSKREAARLLLLIAILMKFANRKVDRREGQCLLLIGTHPLKNETIKQFDQYFNDDLKKKTEALLGDMREVWDSLNALMGKPQPRRTDAKISAFSLEEAEVKREDADYWNYPQRDWVWELADDPNLWSVENRDATPEETKKSENLQKFLGSQLMQFLQECSWCNRSRSWRQLLQLPSVRAFAGQILLEDSVIHEAIEAQGKWLEVHKTFSANDGPPILSSKHPATYLDSLKHYDERSRALRILLNGALRRKKMFLQAGGFYYMSGLDRSSLRQWEKEEFEKSSFVQMHQRMAQFFERNYNQSGDVTALSHYFWHTFQLIEHHEKEFKKAETIGGKAASKSAYWEAMENCVYRMLENSMPARGSLYAYDHCFLLLQLWDKLVANEVEFDDNVTSTEDFRRRVLNTICEIYEDNLDARSETDAAIQVKELAVDKSNNRSKYDKYDIARAHYRLQKAHWQGMKAAGSFRSAHHALSYLLLKENRHTAFRRIDVECKTLDAASLDTVFDAICMRLNVPNLSISKSALLVNNLTEAEIQIYRVQLQKEYKLITTTSHRVLFHRIVQRMIRSLIRIARFSYCTCPDVVGENVARRNKICIENMVDVLLAFGDDLNLGDSPTASTTKLLTTRYLSAAGLYALYNIGVTKEGAGLKMTFYNHQAQARAIRAEGATSKIYEANTSMDEAEMLLWRARLTLSKLEIQKSQNDKELLYNNATARQNAAIRYFGAARLELLEGNVALASWLELTVLRAAVTADILKRISCQYADLNQQSDVLQDSLLPSQSSKLRDGLAKARAENKAEVEKSIEEKLRGIEKKQEWLKGKAKPPLFVAEFKDYSVERMEGTLNGIPKKKAALIADFARQTERAAFELGHLLPLMRDDVWRGARAGIQLLRIAGYICRMLHELWALKAELDAAEPTDIEIGSQLIVALETFIRAINIIDLGRPTPLKPLPRTTDDVTAWNDFEAKLWKGFAKWVEQIDAWMERILPGQLVPQEGETPTLIQNQWTEFQGAYIRFKGNRREQKETKLRFDLLMQVKDDFDALEEFKRDLASPETIDAFLNHLYKWPVKYALNNPRPNAASGSDAKVTA